MEEIGPNPENLSTHGTFNQHGITKKIKKISQKIIATTTKKETAKKYLSKFTTKLYLYP